MLLNIEVRTPSEQKDLSRRGDLSDRLKTGELHFKFIERRLPCAGVSRVAEGIVTRIDVTTTNVTIYSPQVYAGQVQVGLSDIDFTNHSWYSIMVDDKPIQEPRLFECIPFDENDDLGDEHT